MSSAKVPLRMDLGARCDRRFAFYSDWHRHIQVTGPTTPLPHVTSRLTPRSSRSPVNPLDAGGVSPATRWLGGGGGGERRLARIPAGWGGGGYVRSQQPEGCWFALGRGVRCPRWWPAGPHVGLWPTASRTLALILVFWTKIKA